MRAFLHSYSEATVNFLILGFVLHCHVEIFLLMTLCKQTKADAGPDWFNLPKTNLTPELKRDFQLLKMRGVLESKRFYKKESSKAAVPTFSQVGTVIEGPAEQFSSRLPKKEQKNTLLEQILADSTATKRFKKGYNDIQKSKTSGKKAFYKKLKEKRSRGVNKR